ncbi:MAG: hypothetical protein AAB642_03525 [Patescibacteria group bacterium]
MPAIDSALVPSDMVVAKTVTPHCFINQHGQVVFLRRSNGQTKAVVLDDIFSAISQCFHILDRNIGEVVDFYHDNPTVFIRGEINLVRGLSADLQLAVTQIIAPDGLGEHKAIEIQRRFAQIGRDLKRARNQHKQVLAAHLKQVSGVKDQRGRGQPEAAVMAGAANLAALQRFCELDDIREGVTIQLEKLMGIVAQAEERVKRVYDALGRYEDKIAQIIGRIEKDEVLLGRTPIDVYSDQLRGIAKEVAGEGGNMVVNALRGVVPVEPFKTRIESRDVKCLEKLDSYLDEWETGEPELLYTFYRAFGRARSKLKRLVREPRIESVEKNFSREYQRA